MLKITTSSGVFGPYHAITELPDRYDCDGRHLPFTVVGNDGVIEEWVGDLPVAPATPPASVSMRQARLALLGAGYLAQVDAAVAGMPGVEGDAARIEWEYATEVVRTSALTQALAGVLGLTEAQIDSLFVEAGKL